MIVTGKYRIKVSGGVVYQKDILSKESNNTNVNLQRAQMPIAQEWHLSISAGQNNTFNVLTTDPSMKKQKFLSCRADGSLVDLYDEDDGSGRQRWSFVPFPGQPDTYYVMIVNGLTTDRRFLSCKPDGSIVDLWNQDDGSGRQRWVVTKIE